MGKKNKKPAALARERSEAADPAASSQPTTTATSHSPSTSPSTSTSASTSTSTPPPEPTPPPISSARLPLVDLSPGDLGAFFELCFPDKRLVELCRELQLHTPGYRLEALPPDQVARVLADEYLAAKDVRPHLDGAVREVLRDPVLESREVSALDLGQLLDLVVAGDPLQHLARIAWRALLAPGEPERRMALEAIDEGVRALDAPAQQKKPPRKAPPPGQKEAEEAVKRAERAEREREAMRQQLAQARGEISAREQRLAEQKAELGQARSEVSRLSADVARLSAAGEGRALADARRYADEARGLADKLRGAEEAREAAQDRVSQLERRLAQAAQAAAPQPSGEADLPSEEEASTFLVPVLTKEFYDSIERWDRRMQRAAFDKIHRLANDWRHGSLRALALEGVPGYYRIRVATDVRLIYRRDGSRLEVLSLIDREDLDRYIRQARTRPA
jgi:predicted  nucleic acid-binding Zn-ribbon protein